MNEHAALDPQFPWLWEYAHRIDKAKVYDVAIETRLVEAENLSDELGRPVLLKMETDQRVRSFKLRGAVNKIANLSEIEKAAGIITASAGNHAQGVALAAKILGIKATIVMPSTTPEVKIKAVRRHGANVVLHGASFPEALKHAQMLQEQSGMTFVHPYDDKHVIAGQGTIAKEIFAQHDGPIETIFVQVGGGGLAAGIAAWTKFHHPNVRIIAVEPEGSNCLDEALREDSRIVLPKVTLFADGVAVAQIGEEPFLLLRDLVDEVITVSAEEICVAAQDVCTDTMIFPEAAGAVSTAGLKKYAARQTKPCGALVSIVSGANLDLDRRIAMELSAARNQNREMLLGVGMPEEAGGLKKFCGILNGYNITEFNYRYAGPGQAHVFIGLGVPVKEREGTLAKLAANDFDAIDLTNDELAVEHGRHMVGGRPPGELNEVTVSFKFPERPGELLRFLNTMPTEWNISMFHYRSKGDAHGHVLMGLQVQTHDLPLLEKFIVETSDEFGGKIVVDNPFYKRFLGVPPRPARSVRIQAEAHIM